MGDYDPCECVWNHEHAMRRLINMLRSSQDACTDSECLTTPLGPQGADGANDASNSTTMMIMMAWLVIAAVMFMFRPSSMRQQVDPKARQGNNDRGEGPPPPPAVN